MSVLHLCPASDPIFIGNDIFQLWDLSSYESLTTSCRGCCRCLFAAVSFLRGLFIWGITWSFSTSTWAGIFRGERPFPRNHYPVTNPLHSSFSFLYFNRAKTWALWLVAKHRWQLHVLSDSPWTQTDITCCSTRKQPTQVTQTSTIPSGVSRVSKWLLIGLQAQADIGANRLIQNNTSDHVNLYLRGDQM